MKALKSRPTSLGVFLDTVSGAKLINVILMQLKARFNCNLLILMALRLSLRLNFGGWHLNLRVTSASSRRVEIWGLGLDAFCIIRWFVLNDDRYCIKL